MAAQGIVAGIKQGCELLREGKAQIGEVKKTIGEVKAFVGEAKSVWSELHSLWSLVSGLFGGKPAAPKPIAKPEAAAPVRANKKAPEPELSYEEYQARAIHDICEKLKQFFEIKRQLAEHCHRLEEESKTTADIEGAALDRIQIEMQMEAMTVQIREAMIYTPKDIGLQAIYSRFLKMYDQILEEREYYRQLKVKQARDEKWRREYRRNLLTAKMVYAVIAGLIYLEMVGLYLGLSSRTGW